MTNDNNKITNFESLDVLVLGLGQSGLAMVRYLHHQGARLTVVDTRAQPPGLAKLESGFGDAQFRCCPLSEVTPEAFELIAWSPGISIETGAGHDLYVRARQAGVRVVGELDLFAWALESSTDVPNEGRTRSNVIAVTGTNGKTTVTELATLLANSAGVAATAAGNIGPAMLDAWCDAQATGQWPALWVLELSSFQLAISEQAGQQFSPDACALLNVSQDHLDWHASMRTYVQAKQKIAGPNSLAVDFRGQPDTAMDRAGEHRSIGLDEPRRIGDMGLVHEGGIAWLAWAIPAESPIPGKRKKVPVASLVRRLMPAEALHIRGAHNHLNALAALSLCHAVGIEMAAMLHGLREYHGAANRCQFIGVIDEVEFYNDSKGTNVGATVAALEGLGRPCWLIAGGQGKAQDFKPLGRAVTEYAAGVVLIGEDAHEIARVIDDCGVEVLLAADLSDAVAQAAAKAQSGQAVLLSPACASFDMFESYVQRGQVFCERVQSLALERGMELPC